MSTLRQGLDESTFKTLLRKCHNKKVGGHSEVDVTTINHDDEKTCCRHFNRY